jgi:hypothetical protein
MLPVILVAVGAYLIGDSVLGDKKYADGGMMSKGGEVNEQEAKEKLVKLKADGKLNFSIGNHGLIFMSLKNGNKKSYDNYKKAYEHYLNSKGVMMAHGGKTQGYDDKEDERLAMEHGKMSKKDLDSTHARRDDARFEERGKMAHGGMFEKPIPAIMDKYGNIKSEKILQQDLEYLKEAYEDKLVTKAEYDKSYDEIKEQIKFLKEDSGMMAKGGSIAENTTVEVGEDKISVIKNRKEKTGYAVYVQAKGYAPMTLDVYATKEAATKKAKALAKKNEYKFVD